LSVYNVFQGAGWRWVFFGRIFVQLVLRMLQAGYLQALYIGVCSLMILACKLVGVEIAFLPRMEDETLVRKLRHCCAHPQHTLTNDSVCS
jgi:hypothetical protein